MSIGERVKELRKKNGMNQEEFSKKLGKTRSMVTHLENDNTMPTADTIIEMCKIFNVSADYILIGIEEIKDRESEKEILHNYRQLTEKNKGKADLLVEELLEKQKASEPKYEKEGIS